MQGDVQGAHGAVAQSRLVQERERRGDVQRRPRDGAQANGRRRAQMREDVRGASGANPGEDAYRYAKAAHEERKHRRGCATAHERAERNAHKRAKVRKGTKGNADQNPPNYPPIFRRRAGNREKNAWLKARTVP